MNPESASTSCPAALLSHEFRVVLIHSALWLLFFHVAMDLDCFLQNYVSLVGQLIKPIITRVFLLTETSETHS